MAQYIADSTEEILGYLNGGIGYPSSFGDGDRIIVNSGTYLLDQDVQSTAGRLAGVNLVFNRGVIIQPSGGFGRWSIDLDGSINEFSINGNGATINLDGLADLDYAAFNLIDGTFTIENLNLGSETILNSGNILTAVSDAYLCVVNLNNCTIHDAGNNIVSTKVNTVLDGNKRASWIYATHCHFYNAGPSGSCIYTEDGFGASLAGGVISDAEYVAKSSSNTTFLDLYNVVIRRGRLQNIRNLVNCNYYGSGTLFFDCPDGNLISHNTLIFTENFDGIVLENSSSNSHQVISNIILNIFPSSGNFNAINIQSEGSQIIGNYIKGVNNFSSAIKVAENSTGTHKIIGNICEGCLLGLDIRGDSSPNVELTKNYLFDNFDYDIFTSGSPIISIKDKNLITGLISGYTFGKTDTSNSMLAGDYLKYNDRLSRQTTFKENF